VRLSIIIPVFNEEKKIREDISAISEFLCENHITGEIIISDDGSTDDTVKIASETPICPLVQLSVITDSEHIGKGHAVRKGVIQSKGNFVLFIDSGNTVELDAIIQGLNKLQNCECQIVLGSRHLPDSIITKPLAFHRRLVSTLFRIFIKIFFPSLWGYTDTQCGFKIYDGDIARTLYKGSVINGFLFDIEILKKAKKQKVTIQESPIEWTCDRDSRLSFIPTIWEVIQDSWNLKFR